MSEVSNIRSVRQMLNDMRWNILRNFQIARDILKPLYEVARLNSKVTRGASVVLDDLQKGRVKAVGDYATLQIHRRPRAFTGVSKWRPPCLLFRRQRC